MVLIDPFSLRIIGFAVHHGDVGDEAFCSMFPAIVSILPTPKRLSLNDDPLYPFEH